MGYIDVPLYGGKYTLEHFVLTIVTDASVRPGAVFTVYRYAPIVSDTGFVAGLRNGFPCRNRHGVSAKLPRCTGSESGAAKDAGVE